ncbi:MAG: acetate/propionate family kinase [Marinibacterium sp.]
MTGAILTINAGSSSIKFALYEVLDGALTAEPLASGSADGIGSRPHLVIRPRDAAGPKVDEDLDPAAGHREALARILGWIDSAGAPPILAAGHRVVLGGAGRGTPERVTPALMTSLERLVPLMPLHQPHNLEPIRALLRTMPDLPQVACFDTGFHAGLSWEATAFALPREYEAEGVRRYGFHGLSYEYIASVMAGYLGTAAHGKVVVAHLGNGASMCAMQDGRSVATTMGFSALDGLVMGTRPGSLDPGVLLYLIQEKGMDHDALTDLLYHRSGLLGVSGISNDMRTLLASDAPEAAQAVRLFVYRATRELGSLAAALGGLDALVFTGGIGEHAAPVRAAICRDAAWLGITCDPQANAGGEAQISTASGRVPVFVIPTDEDLMIARHSLDVIAAAPRQTRNRPETGRRA